jgi:hypothetical protein
VDRFFHQVTRVISTGPDETSLDNPKATISVIYGNSDSSVKVTITVDEYRSSEDASSAFQQALAASEKVPGFQPIRTGKLGQQAFAGTVTMGGETHIGSGVLDGRLIIGVTLAGFDATRSNISNLFAIVGIEDGMAKLTLPLVNTLGVLNPGDAKVNFLRGVLTNSTGASVASIPLFGQYIAAGFGAIHDSGTDMAIAHTSLPQPGLELAASHHSERH